MLAASFGRTTGLRSTRIAENGNVSAFGLPARNETIPGRFSAANFNRVSPRGSKPTDAAAVRVKRLAHRAGTILELWTGGKMVSILCIVFWTSFCDRWRGLWRSTASQRRLPMVSIQGMRECSLALGCHLLPDSEMK